MRIFKRLYIIMNAVILYVCTVVIGGEGVSSELQKQVMLEQVELIARLTSEGACKERDRVVALNLIAEIARNISMTNKQLPVVFSTATFGG